jgi:hypothetical protein
VADTASAATPAEVRSPVKRATPAKPAPVRAQQPVAAQAVSAIGPIAQAVADADTAEQQLRRIQQRLQQRSVHPYGTGYEERQTETGEQKAQVPERGGAPERVERVEKPTLERVERPVVERVERPTQDRPGGAQAGGRR